MNAPLLKDVFTIPERAGSEDYVLRLTSTTDDEGAAQAIENYVVTPEITRAFDQALDLISSAIRERKNRGAFLAGSFGSGKSHFMSVLHALLRHRPEARQIQELQQVIARHDDALRDKTILPLAFHFLDAESMEEAIFDGYVEQIRDLHPDSGLPSLYRSDDLLRDAETMRHRMGDKSFFEGLGGDESEEDEWSMILGEAAWDLERYEAARAASPQSSERQALVSALEEHYFSSYTRHGTYVDLDEGLHAISAHASNLGYDAVVLFLDELVLWLAFATHTPEFFRRELQKITKLVEGSYGQLPIPLVSFIARQMDLSQWFADAGSSGSQQEMLDQAFRHQEGRFATITLGDENLPYVAKKRLLQPKDGAAEDAIEQAFDQLERRPEVWDVLLDGVNTDERHRGADEKTFRLTYPFSPALVSTLRALSGVMQRDRTALKVMQQMLVDRRDTMTIDEVIPVGDTFDHIVTGKGDSVLDPQVAVLFRSADQLWDEKLQPMLLNKYDLVPHDLLDRESLPPSYIADERLAKTLLLSAVATTVPALREMTASRLASLNHGSITSPLPGNEARVVAAKVRDWSTTVPEIHISDDPLDPVVRVQLADVDYESIVEKARGEDNAGRQRNMVRRLLLEQLEIDLDEEPDITGARHAQIIWRGSRRDVEIVFGNMRDPNDLPEDRLRATNGAWRLIIDHPFDEQGHSPGEDIARVEALLARNFSSHTLLWLPRFLSNEKMKDLRRLVVLDWLLTGSEDRWNQYSRHLSETDRNVAKEILQGQRRSLHDQLLKAIAQAYGVAEPQTGVLQEGASAQIVWSLDRSFTPTLATNRPMKDAFTSLVTDAFDTLYPDHPEFEPADQEVRIPQLQLVLKHVDKAVAHPEHRIPLEGDANTVRRVANAAKIGYATETHFLFTDDRFGDWPRIITAGLAKRDLSYADTVTVQTLREILQEIEPARGLREEVADTVIIAWAASRQRAWYAYQQPVTAPVVPGKLQGTWELRTQPMPKEAEWEKARERAAIIFGTQDQPYLTISAVNRLNQQVTERAAELAPAAQQFVNQLSAAYKTLNLAEGSRLEMAKETASLVRTLQELSGVPLVQHLASVQLPGTDLQAAVSLKQASSIADVLKNEDWGVFRVLSSAEDNSNARGTEAARILENLRYALRAHEDETPLAPAMQQAKTQAWDWIERDSDAPSDSRTKKSQIGTPIDVAWNSRVVTWGPESVEQLVQELEEVDAYGRRVELRWRILDED